jgi:hypothetical protein
VLIGTKKSHSPGREWLIKIFLVYSISLPFSQQIIAAAEKRAIWILLFVIIDTTKQRKFFIFTDSSEG